MPGRCNSIAEFPAFPPKMVAEQAHESAGAELADVNLRNVDEPRRQDQVPQRPEQRAGRRSRRRWALSRLMPAALAALETLRVRSSASRKRS